MLASGWTPEGHFMTGGSKDWSYLRLLNEEPIDKPIDTKAPSASPNATIVTSEPTPSQDSSISSKPTPREVNISNSPVASITNTLRPTSRENNLSKSPVASIDISGKPTSKVTLTSSPSNAKTSNGIELTIDSKAGGKRLQKSGKSESPANPYIDPDDEEAWAEYSLLNALSKTGKKDSVIHSLSMHTFGSSAKNSKSSKRDGSMSHSNNVPSSTVSKLSSKSSKSYENEMSVSASKGAKAGFQLSVSLGSHHMTSTGSKSSKTHSHSYSLSMSSSPEPPTKNGAGLKKDTAVENEIQTTPNLPKHQDSPSKVNTAFEPSSKDGIPVISGDIPSSASSRNLLSVFIAVTFMVCLLLAEPSVSLAPTAQKKHTATAVKDSSRDLMSEKKAKAIKSVSAKAEKHHSSKSVNGKGSKIAHISDMESMSMPSSAPSVSASPSKFSYHEQNGSGKSSNGVSKASSKSGKASSKSGKGEPSHSVSGKSSKNVLVSDIESMSMHSSVPSITPSETMGPTIGNSVEGSSTSGSDTSYTSIIPSSLPLTSSIPTGTNTPVQSSPNDASESQVASIDNTEKPTPSVDITIPPAASIISTAEPTPSPTMIDYATEDSALTNDSVPTSTYMPIPSPNDTSESQVATIEESEEPTPPTPSNIGLYLSDPPAASIVTDEPTPSNTLSKSPVASLIWLPSPMTGDDEVKGDAIPTTSPTNYGQYLLGLNPQQNRDPSLPESQASPEVNNMLESLEDIASNAYSRSGSLVTVFLLLILQLA